MATCPWRQGERTVAAGYMPSGFILSTQWASHNPQNALSTGTGHSTSTMHCTTQNCGLFVFPIICSSDPLRNSLTKYDRNEIMVSIGFWNVCCTTPSSLITKRGIAKGTNFVHQLVFAEMENVFGQSDSVAIQSSGRKIGRRTYSFDCHQCSVEVSE